MPATDGEERAEPAVPAAAAGAPAAASDEPGPSSTTAAAAQINRPSNKRRRNLRQTRVTAGDDDGDVDAEANADEERGNNASAGPSIDHATLIEDTRALQKQRSKRTGIDTATLLLGSSRDRAKASLAASGAASDAEALAAANQLSATEAALGNTFGAGSAGGAGAASRAREEAEAAADAEAARYVESRLAAALGRAPRSKRIEGDDGGGEGASEDGRGGGGGASLFEAPREARLSLPSASGAAGGDADASALEPRGAGLGGDDDARGAVGLVEVALSAGDRLLNIERTEAAKRRAGAAASGAAAPFGGSHAASSSGFGGDGDGFRRRDLPASFGAGKRR